MITSVAIHSGNASLGPYDTPSQTTVLNPDCFEGPFSDLLDRVKINKILSLRDYLAAVQRSDAKALAALQEDIDRRSAELERRAVGCGSTWLEFTFTGPDERSITIESGYEIDLGAEYRELVQWIKDNGVNLLTLPGF